MGFTGLGKSLLFFKDIFSEDEADKKKSRKIGVSIESEAEIIKDQIFKKPESLKKILNKFSSKTFTIKEEDSEENFEVDIKISICNVFDYIFAMREDFFIENVVECFKSVFLEKAYNSKREELEKMDLTEHIKNLLPDSYAEVSTTVDPAASKFKNYTKYEEIRSFDIILERPFLESVLLSFFFTQSAPLQNALLGILERCCTEKKRIKKSIKRLELLFSDKHKKLYTKMQSKLNKLKNLTSNAQVNVKILKLILLDLATNH